MGIDFSMIHIIQIIVDLEFHFRAVPYIPNRSVEHKHIKKAFLLSET
jgi:hypothetical protein